MENAICYIRVSSEKQQDEGYSPEAQRRYAEEYAKRKNLNLVKIWEASETAKKEGRKKFNELLKYAKEKTNVRHIIFEKTDRMTRNFPDLIAIYELMENYDKKIHFSKTNTIMDKTSKSSEKLHLEIEVVLAKNYIDNLSEETKKGMLEKARQGEWPFAGPFPYLRNKTTKTLIVNRELSDYAIRAYKSFSTGLYSTHELAKELSKELAQAGIKKRFYKSQIHSLLRNPLCAGFYYIKNDKGELERINGKHEPIIPEELFNRVQDVLDGRHHGAEKKRSFAFMGLMTCAKCRSSITAEIKKGKYVYYHCADNQCKKDGRYIPESEIETHMLGVLDNIHIDDKRLAWLTKKLLEDHKTEKRHSERVLISLESRYKQLKDLIHSSYEDKIRGNITEQFWREIHQKLTAEQQEVESSLAIQRQDTSNYMITGVKLIELAHNAYSLYKKQTSQEKNRLLKFILSNCELNDKIMRPEYKKPFDIIAKGVQSKNKLPRLDSNQQHPD